MLLKIKLKFIILFLLIISVSSCLEDSIQPEFSIELQNSAELLTYLESQGDYINSDFIPSLVDADDVFANLTTYLIIDVRDAVLFSNGHIENAINVQSAELLNYLESIQVSSYNKIVIVSESGQSASYYTCLMRLLGYQNIYALKFGMAIWNIQFSDIWLNSLKGPLSHWKFDNINYDKPNYSNLPGITLSSDGTMESKLRLRIIEFLEMGFKEEEIIEPGPGGSSNKNNNIDDAADPTINILEMYHNFNEIEAVFAGHYVMCYGDKQLYHPLGFAGSFDSLAAHPPKTVFYKSPIYSELRTISFLQSIPSNLVVVVYSVSGHESAFITAYLRLLGYNAKSLVFGASYFNYNAIRTKSNLIHLVYNESDIRNYPFFN